MQFSKFAGSGIRPLRRHIIFVLSAGLVFIFALGTLLFPKLVGAHLAGAKSWVLNQFDGLFAISPIIALVVCLGLAMSPLGRIRLGGADARPEFRRHSWVAMLFAAGVGIGFMFYGVAEPLAYYTNWFGVPLDAVPGSPDARRLAFSATLFHWGIAPWALYAIMGLVLGFFAYNKGFPLTIRSAFYPLLGQRIWGWPGHIIDLFAVVSTVFGLATTIGIGAMQATSGMSFLFGIDTGLGHQILVIGLISGLAMISVMRGLDRGVKWLSNFNMVLAMMLLIFVIIAGPTLAIFMGFGAHLVEYFRDMPALANWIGRSDTAWFHDWTIFYWAWWISWSPFVGMFIARISCGRTIREYVVVLLLVPTLIALVWFTAFGETALAQFETGHGELANGIDSAPLALFQMLAGLPFSELTSIIALILLLVFIVTSVDSGALIVDALTSGDNRSNTKEAVRKSASSGFRRVFWAAMLGIVASVLLYGGGETALQTLQAGTIVAALPFTLILLFGCFSLVLGLLSVDR